MTEICPGPRPRTQALRFCPAWTAGPATCLHDPHARRRLSHPSLWPELLAWLAPRTTTRWGSLLVLQHLWRYISGHPPSCTADFVFPPIPPWTQIYVHDLSPLDESSALSHPAAPWSTLVNLGVYLFTWCPWSGLKKRSPSTSRILSSAGVDPTHLLTLVSLLGPTTFVCYKFKDHASPDHLGSSQPLDVSMSTCLGLHA
jgi:hypothetical protein